MDGVAEKSSEKRRRKHNEDKESVDRISALTDALLSRILSFLPIDQAVKTCLLSKRWRFVWTSLSKLKFNDDIIPRHLKGKKRKSARWLEKFVDEVLGVRGSSSISKLLLLSSFGYNTLRVRSWISTSIARNVEELSIRIGGSRYIKLPHSLYTCDKLKVLSLYGPFDFNVPDSVCLTNLTNAILEDIAFDDHSLNMLLSTCGALEVLFLKRSLDSHGWMSNVCSLSLKSLTIMDYSESPDTSDCTVVIDTPGLKDLILFIKDGWRKNYSLKESPSLEMAGFCTFSAALKPDVFVNLLKSVSNVKKLQLLYFNQELLEGDELQKLPVFHNLKHLMLDFEEASWHYLEHFLDRSPNLALLKLEFGPFRGWQEPNQVSECLSSHLKEVMISGYNSSSHELQVVGYLLKSGKGLQKMTIQNKSYTNRDHQPSDDLEPNVKVSFLKWLLLFPRGSSLCQIAFC